MSFDISPKSILKFLLALVSLFALAQLCIIAAQQVPGHGRYDELIRIFNLNNESNVPTLFSSINLAISACLLFCIGMMHRRTGTAWKAWVGLSLVMMFLSIDETASIHEKFRGPSQAVLGSPADLYYVWILPYLLAAAILFLAYLKFFMRLPVRTRFLFFLSGGIFILGAAGLEVHGNLEQVRQLNTLSYRFGVLMEEILEMLGVVCFIYALTDYAVNKFGSFAVTVAPHKSTVRASSQRYLA